MTYAPKPTVAKARTLRRKLTLPEVVVWSALRGRRLGGIRFRRQHPVGPYILDFYCEDTQLAVEIDGQGHDHLDAVAHDQRRTAWLSRHGISVMRIPARETSMTCFSAFGVAFAVSPLHRLRRSPPPMGEDCLIRAVRGSNADPTSLGSAPNSHPLTRPPVTEADIKRVETHLKRTFNHGGLKVKARKQTDSAEVYVDDEFIGVVFEDEDEAGSYMFEMAILAEDLPQA